MESVHLLEMNGQRNGGIHSKWNAAQVVMCNKWLATEDNVLSLYRNTYTTQY